MLKSTLLTIALASTALGVTAPSAAIANDRDQQSGQHGDDGDEQDDGDQHQSYRQNRHYDDGHYDRARDHRQYCRRSDGTTGLIIGGAGGALIGRELGRRRDRTVGTIIGAGVGALAGRAIERGSSCR